MSGLLTSPGGKMYVMSNVTVTSVTVTSSESYDHSFHFIGTLAVGIKVGTLPTSLGSVKESQNMPIKSNIVRINEPCASELQGLKKN